MKDVCKSAGDSPKFHYPTNEGGDPVEDMRLVLKRSVDRFDTGADCESFNDKMLVSNDEFHGFLWRDKVKGWEFYTIASVKLTGKDIYPNERIYEKHYIQLKDIDGNVVEKSVREKYLEDLILNFLIEQDFKLRNRLGI